MTTEGIKLQITADVNDAVAGLNTTAQAVAALKVEQRLLSGEMVTVTSAIKTNATELAKNVAVEQTAIKNKLVHGQAYKELKTQILTQQLEEKRLTDILQQKNAQLEVSKAELKAYQLEMNNASAGATKLSRAVNNLTDTNSLAAGGVMRLRRMLISSAFMGVAFAITEGLIPAIMSLVKQSDAGARAAKLYNDALDEAQKTVAKAHEQVGDLRSEIDSARKGLISKKQVVEDYNDTLGKTIGFAKNLQEVEDNMAKHAQQYINLMMLKAVATALLGKAAEKAAEAQIKAQKDVAEFSADALKSTEGQASIMQGLAGLMPGGGGGASGASHFADAERLQKSSQVTNATIDAHAIDRLYEDAYAKVQKYANETGLSIHEREKENISNLDKLKKQQFEIDKKDLENAYKSEEDMAYKSHQLTSVKAIELEIKYLEQKVELYRKYGQRIFDIQVALDKKYEEQKAKTQFSVPNAPTQTNIQDASKKDINSMSAMGRQLELLALKGRLWKEQLQGTADIVTGVLDSGFSKMFTDIVGGTQSVGQALGRMLGDLIKQLTATFLKAAALAGIMTLITGGTSAGASSFGANFMQFAGFAHAQGGVIANPTQMGNHLFGEAGPEAVIPLNRMGEFANTMGNNGGGGQMDIAGILRGEDIYLMNQRVNQRRGRIY